MPPLVLPLVVGLGADMPALPGCEPDMIAMYTSIHPRVEESS